MESRRSPAGPLAVFGAAAAPVRVARRELGADCQRVVFAGVEWYCLSSSSVARFSSDGVERWRVAVDSPGSLRDDGESCVLAFGDHRGLLVLDPATGAERWRDEGYPIARGLVGIERGQAVGYDEVSISFTHLAEPSPSYSLTPCARTLASAAVRGEMAAAGCEEGILWVGPIGERAALAPGDRGRRGAFRGGMRPIQIEGLGEDDFATALAWLDARTLVVGSRRGGLYFVRVDTEEVFARIAPLRPRVTALEPMADILLVRFEGGVSGLLDVATRAWRTFPQLPGSVRRQGDRLEHAHGGTLETWAFSRDATRRVFDLGVGLTDVSVAPSGRSLAVSGAGGTVALFALPSGRPGPRHVLAANSVVKRVALADDRTFLAVTAGAGVFSGVGTTLEHHAGATYHRRGLLMPDGHFAAFRYEAEPTERFGVRPFRALAPVPQPAPYFVGDAELDERSGRAWLLDNDGVLYRYARDEYVRVGPALARDRAFAVAASGGRVWVTSASALVALAEPGSGAALATRALDSRAMDVAVSPSGRRLATGHLDGSVRVWDAELRLLAEIHAHTERAAAVRFFGEDALFSASWDGTARRYGLGELEAPARAVQARMRRVYGADAFERQFPEAER